MSPIAATFEGWSIFTGDESIRTRPVAHMVDVLNQMGGEAHIAIPGKTTCPMVIKGPVSTRNRIVTEGSVSSQYISGLMMAATRMKGTLKIELTNPKETPYLTMTKIWLESVGVTVRMSNDFKHIEIDGPVDIKAFEKTIPSDGEAVAFPLIAALITDSEITIDDVDSSGTQGDDAIVDVLKSIGADIQWDKTKNTLTVRGGKKSTDKIGRLSTDNLPGKEPQAKPGLAAQVLVQLQLQHVSLKEQPILRISAFAGKKKLTALKFSKRNSQNLEQMLRMVLIS